MIIPDILENTVGQAVYWEHCVSAHNSPVFKHITIPVLEVSFPRAPREQRRGGALAPSSGADLPVCVRPVKCPAAAPRPPAHRCALAAMSLYSGILWVRSLGGNTDGMSLSRTVRGLCREDSRAGSDSKSWGFWSSESSHKSGGWYSLLVGPQLQHICMVSPSAMWVCIFFNSSVCGYRKLPVMSFVPYPWKSHTITPTTVGELIICNHVGFVLDGVGLGENSSLWKLKFVLRNTG